jgi:hypothetical protein
MLHASAMNESFWPHPFHTAIFVTNRSWHYGMGGIPYEKFTGHIANVNMLHIFGSWYWARKPATHLAGHNKLQQRGILCRMHGYDQHGHSYRLLDVESDKVITATHVTFDEHARTRPDNLFVGENAANTSNKSSCDCKQCGSKSRSRVDSG